MELFKSGNPTLSEKIFDRNGNFTSIDGTMTAQGTMAKFGFLMLMVLGAASYTWHLYDNANYSLMTTLLFVGIIGGTISGFAMVFKPNWAQYIAPAYGLFEGLFLGAISAYFNNAFQNKYPGLVLQAVGLTFGVAFSMFLLYNFKVIKATETFKSVIISATMGIGVFYLITMVLRSLFHVDMPFMNDSSILGIGISLFVVAIAALNLILDFDMIEKGAEQGAPKYMEWYSAFALLVTIVWLYIEILKLLSRLSKRN